MAVIASEDNRFAEHNGFDMIEIKKAMKENEKRKRKRGASTISQQTAKNVCPLATIIVGAQRIRGLLYFSHRALLVERANHDSILKLH